MPSLGGWALKPPAVRWPPPPYRAAIALTSTPPDVEQGPALEAELLHIDAIPGPEVEVVGPQGGGDLLAFGQVVAPQVTILDVAEQGRHRHLVQVLPGHHGPAAIHVEDAVGEIGQLAGG